MSLNSHFIASRIFIQTFEFAFAQAENLEIVEGFSKPYPLSRTFLREREKQQFLPEPLLLSFY